jgi:hypothetical protein
MALHGPVHLVCLRLWSAGDEVRRTVGEVRWVRSGSAPRTACR